MQVQGECVGWSGLCKAMDSFQSQASAACFAGSVLAVPNHHARALLNCLLDPLKPLHRLSQYFTFPLFRYGFPA